jgi:hypothetical protein
MKPEIDIETFLTRQQTATALTDLGYTITDKTLATKASRGDGPPYHLFGRKPLYRWGDALGWAQRRTTRAVHNTAEGRAALLKHAEESQ